MLRRRWPALRGRLAGRGKRQGAGREEKLRGSQPDCTASTAVRRDRGPNARQIRPAFEKGRLLLGPCQRPRCDADDTPDLRGPSLWMSDDKTMRAWLMDPTTVWKNSVVRRGRSATRLR